MNIINRKSLFATVLCLTITGPAFAAVKSSPHIQSPAQSETVTYADLDISSAEGLATLQTRLKMAAKRVCFVHDGTLSLQARIRRQDCFDSTMQKATEKLGIDNAVGMVQ
jgi:UrcA family protein